MGRVTNHYVGLGHLLHHALLGPLALDLLDFSLNLGVAFCLLIFFLNLLFGHFQLALIVPPLIEVVEEGQHRERDGDLEHQSDNLVEEDTAGLPQLHSQETAKTLGCALEVVVD